MNSKEQLRQIIREELKAVLEEQARNWWHTPAESEIDGHLLPSEVHEKKEPKPRKPRPGIGKNSGGKYTSAGTVPYIQGRKLDTQQVQNRKEIGQKMLNALRRGDPSAVKFRDRLKQQLDKRGLPKDPKHQYSMIWANASSIAADGGTASSWNVGSGKKKKKKAASSKKKSAPPQPNTPE